MKRPVFTIVEGFVGGSGRADQFIPRRLKDAEHVRIPPADDDTPLPQSSEVPDRCDRAPAGPIGVTGGAKGFA